MVDTRVWKLFFKIMAYGIGAIAALTASMYLSQELLGDASIILQVLLFGYTFYTLFKIAESKVNMDRKEEQRLADQIKDV